MKLNKDTYKQTIHMQPTVNVSQALLGHFAARMVSAPSPWERVGVRLSVRGFWVGVRLSYGLCLLLFILTACTRADIHYPVAPSANCLVHIYPDQSVHSLPAGLYHFYPSGSDTLTRGCDGSGNFVGSLPAGSYRVIGTNTSASNVSFSGMDAYDSACVHALSADSRDASAGDRFLSQPAAVYTVVLSDLSLSGSDTLYHTPSPSLLTRTLRLRFTLEDRLMGQVTGIKGILPGIFPSVLLATGQTPVSDVARSPQVYVRYSGNEEEDGSWLASISLFGLCDPQGGRVYQNTTSLTLALDTQSMNFDIELTDALSAVLSEHGGVLPIEVPIQLNIRLGLTELGAGGSVNSWSYVDDEGAEILVPL